MIWYNDEHRKKAFKSFTSFIVECKSSVFRYKDNEWCCDICSGSGRVIAPWERSDPVEGYKYADRVPCKDCNGTGKWDEKRWREWFKKEKAEYVELQAKKKEKERIRKQALAKLSDIERKVLGV